MNDNSNDLMLMRTMRRLGRLLEDRATPFKGQGRVLGVLRRNGRTMSQRALLDRTGMKSSSLSELTVKLEENGFITKSQDPLDARTVILTLTEKGEAESIRMHKVSEELSSRAFRILSEAEKEDLLTTLLKLEENWREVL
jgi:Transcriptional regulators